MTSAPTRREWQQADGLGGFLMGTTGLARDRRHHGRRHAGGERPARTRFAVCALMLLAGCTSPRDATPAVRDLYRASAQRHVRNPVVVIHGILGARLEQRSTGKTVWGAFTGDSIDPNTPEGTRALALPIATAADLQLADRSDADVVPTGPLGAIQLGLFFTVINVGVYADILRSLGVGGYTDRVRFDPGTPAYAEDHFTCFTFFYDWRRDCVENAIALGAYLTDMRARIERSARTRIEQLRKQGGPSQLRECGELEQWLENGFRFDVVAHSMGGLVARYYLQFGAVDLPADGSTPPVTWAGAKDIDRLVMVGTPNFGSMESLQTLLHGFTPGLLLPHFDAAILGSMTSLYQLMPRNGMGLVLGERDTPVDVDLFDVATWERNGWGLLSPAADRSLGWLLPDERDAAARRARARDVVAWNLARARHFHAALDQAPVPPCPTDIRLFAADTIPTLARTRLAMRAGKLEPQFDGDNLRQHGDGTVTRSSAVADRRVDPDLGAWLDSPVPWSAVTFLPDDHIGLTRNPIFTDNLLFYLLEQPPRSRALDHVDGVGR